MLGVRERRIGFAGGPIVAVVAQAVNKQQVRPDLPTVLREKIPEERVIPRAWESNAGVERSVGERSSARFCGQVSGDGGEDELAVNVGGLRIERLLETEAGLDGVRAFDDSEVVVEVRNFLLETVADSGA